MIPLLKVNNLKKYYPFTKGFFRRESGELRAVDDVSFAIYPGETLGLVGESGSGKTTTAKLILRLTQPTDGTIQYDNHGEWQDVHALDTESLHAWRKNVQMVFQDPFSSLNPRMTVFDIIAEPLQAQKAGTPQEIKERVRWLIDAVGLEESFLPRYPHAFSGGQRQRIGIARALALNPKLLICDEPVSALDVSVQAQVLNLLKEFQKQFNISYLFIAHDLTVVENISDRIAVMYAGRLVEIGQTEDVFNRPRHPYTETLIKAVPEIDSPAAPAESADNEVPDLAKLPTGCAFHPRCPYAVDICREKQPQLTGNGQQAACHRMEELQLHGIQDR